MLRAIDVGLDFRQGVIAGILQSLTNGYARNFRLNRGYLWGTNHFVNYPQLAPRYDCQPASPFRIIAL